MSNPPRLSLLLAPSLVLIGACSAPNPPQLSDVALGFTAAHAPSAEEENGEVPRRHRVGVFGGVTGLANGEASGTFGLEYEWRYNQRWGLGMLIELTPVLDERLVTGPQVYLHPWRESFVTVAPGIVHDEEKDRFAVLRLGAGWEFELGDGWSFSPQISVDWVEAADDAMVIGVALSRAF